MSRLHWKVCGITNAADADAAVAAGADALGFVFWPNSVRAVSAETAREIAARVPAGVRKVGVFVDPDPSEVDDLVGSVGLDVVQLCGDESPASCAAMPRPVWKALRLAPGSSPEGADDAAGRYRDCTLLVDAGVPGSYGGTGTLADWEIAARLAAGREVVLAGGLDADNVAAAIERVKPWGVDVASGVEVEPGRKSHDALRRFAAALEEHR